MSPQVFWLDAKKVDAGETVRRLTVVGNYDLMGEEARVNGPWKVSCRRTAPGGSGSANGEFSRMADAVAFAEGWLEPGWTATITNPEGVQVELVKGKPPEFPPTPGKSKGGRAERHRPSDPK